jgi:hypothetical protein
VDEFINGNASTKVIGAHSLKSWLACSKPRRVMLVKAAGSG